MSIAKARVDFPLLTQRIRGKPLVYLDSAATALKPWSVIERIGHFYTYETANVHRGAHYLADQGTAFYEASRVKVQNFIGAAQGEEIIFTKGATESINLVAQSYGRKFLKEGDEILITEMEHHANIVPWQMLCEQVGCHLKVAPIDVSGQLQMDTFKSLLSEKTKLVAVTHCSNTLGTINDISMLSKWTHDVGAVILVDGAQIVANHPVSVQDLDVDFFVFSAHKMFGSYGTGVLYGKKKLLDKMPPYQGGGSMISKVTFEKTTYNDVPFKFEAGTPNIEGVISISSAIDYIHKWGWPAITEYESELLKYATSCLGEIPEVKIIGQAAEKAPIVSFNLGKAHHSDVGQILDQQNVAVRVGHHCTEPLLARLGYTGCVRASFSVYNNKADVDALVVGLLKAKELLL